MSRPPQRKTWDVRCPHDPRPRSRIRNHNRLHRKGPPSTGLRQWGASVSPSTGLRQWGGTPKAASAPCRLRRFRIHRHDWLLYTRPPIDSTSSTELDADGARVAKGTITNWSAGCDTTQNGFTMTASYILGPGNEQLAELSWSGGVPTPVHTNVWAGGQLAATLRRSNQLPGRHPLLPAHRLAAGVPSGRSSSLGWTRHPPRARRPVRQPGPNLRQPALRRRRILPEPRQREHLFTGKERDAESGNDYFGARYYASTMGRFMSPDWSAKEEPVPYAKLDNPQSLNLYAYLLNNPLGGIDADGHRMVTNRKIPMSCRALTDYQKCVDDRVKPPMQNTLQTDRHGFIWIFGCSKPDWS